MVPTDEAMITFGMLYSAAGITLALLAMRSSCKKRDGWFFAPRNGS